MYAHIEVLSIIPVYFGKNLEKGCTLRFSTNTPVLVNGRMIGIVTEMAISSNALIASLSWF